MSLFRKSHAFLRLCKHHITSSVNKYFHNKDFDIPKPVFNVDYLCDFKNKDIIDLNIKLRKSNADINVVLSLWEKLKNCTENEKDTISLELQEELRKIPNLCHPDIIQYGEKHNEIKHINCKRAFDFEPKDFTDIAKKLNVLRTDHLGNLTGPRSYVLLNKLAKLEEALVRYSLKFLQKSGFTLVSVPDILPSSVIEGCGMSTTGERNQVYKLSPSHGNDLCLSGTSEMALAGMLAGSTITNMSQPVKYAAVSRCYRAETSTLLQERGIYRVHQFTKVEMFVACSPDMSCKVLEDIRALQEAMYDPLQIHMRVLDMPPYELGAPAYRKYDIEAWLPGRKVWGEISSCSNCTDYQSRRLGILFETSNSSDPQFVHTVNGTACAVPRMLIALIETHQNADGTVMIPNVLREYMNGESEMGKNEDVPQIKLVKSIPQPTVRG